MFGGNGTDANRNGFLEADCSYLVGTALKDAGYSIPDRISTHSLFEGNDLQPLATKNFNVVDKNQLQPGDLILLKSNVSSDQHIGIFVGYNDKGQIMFYGSQTSTGPNVATMDGTYWGGKMQYVNAIRPKDTADFYDPTHDTTFQQGQTPATDPTTINLSPTTSATNKFGGETLADLVKRLQAEDAAKKASQSTNHTNTTSNDTSTASTTSSDKSQVCEDTILPKSDLDFKGDANTTTQKLGSSGIIAQTYDSEGNLTNAVVFSSSGKSELSFSDGKIVSSKTTQTDGIVSTKEYSNGIVSSELIQNGDSTTNVAYSNGVPFIATTTNQTDSSVANIIYVGDGKSERMAA